MTTTEIKNVLDKFTAPEIAKAARLPINTIYNMKYGRVKDLKKITKAIKACKVLTENQNLKQQALRDLIAN